MSLTSQERSSKGASTTRLPTPAALRQDSLPSSAREGPIPFSLKERFHDGRQDHRSARLAAASRGRLLPRDLSRLRRPRRTSLFDGHYYLLRAGEVSRWHRIDAAEIWHWYDGDA